MPPEADKVRALASFRELEVPPALCGLSSGDRFVFEQKEEGRRREGFQSKKMQNICYYLNNTHGEFTLLQSFWLMVKRATKERAT